MAGATTRRVDFSQDVKNRASPRDRCRAPNADEAQPGAEKLYAWPLYCDVYRSRILSRSKHTKEGGWNRKIRRAIEPAMVAQTKSA